MRSVVTLVRVSMSRAGERGTVLAMATECAARSGGMGRMTGVPRVVPKPSQGHGHEASCAERQAKRIRIHGALPVRYSVTTVRADLRKG